MIRNIKNLDKYFARTAAVFFNALLNPINYSRQRSSVPVLYGSKSS